MSTFYATITPEHAKPKTGRGFRTIRVSAQSHAGSVITTMGREDDGDPFVIIAVSNESTSGGTPTPILFRGKLSVLQALIAKHGEIK